MSNDKQKLIANIEKDTTLVLKKTAKQGNIWGIDLKIACEFRDTIILIHTNGDDVAYCYKLIGGIDTIYQADWYSDSCLIRFENVKKPIKNFQINYEFFD